MPIDRRQFLRHTALAAALRLVTSTRAARADELAGPIGDALADDVRLARPDLLAVLGPERVRAIGVAYRERVPAERDADGLRAAIRASAASSAHPLWAPPAVAELVREDFARGRTVVVDGWLLAATEARQCALYSLLSL